MSFTGPGWYLLSTTTQQTWSEAITTWGISTSTVYKYIYELKSVPILAKSPSVSLNAADWTGIDISANPTYTLMQMKVYWVNIQTLIVDIFLSGVGVLNNSTVTAKLSSTSTSPQSNAIIKGYTGIGTAAFSGVTNLSTVTIAANTQLTSSSIVSNAFSNSGLKTVIFESTTDLQNLGFNIINTSQNFFGINCLVLPTKAAVQTGLTAAIIASSLAQEQILPLTAKITQAEIAHNIAQKVYDEAYTNVQNAQTNLSNTTPQWLSPPNAFIPQGIPNPAYTTAYNNLVTATEALAIANGQLISAGGQLTYAQTQSNNAQAQVGIAQALVTKLTAAQSFAV